MAPKTHACKACSFSLFNKCFILSMQSLACIMLTGELGFPLPIPPCKFFPISASFRHQRDPTSRILFSPLTQNFNPLYSQVPAPCHLPVYSPHHQILTKQMTQRLCFARNCKTAVLLCKIIILWYCNILKKILGFSKPRLWISNNKTFSCIGARVLN